MGVVNVTPDSFSDGGRFLDQEAAVRHAMALMEQGADILDIGGESTRPGATPVSADEEMARILPVIEAIRRQSAATISVDTMKPDVMRAAYAAGADIWNDVSALGGSPDSAAVAADLGCDVVLMHMQGEPGTMQRNPHYDDVTGEVTARLMARVEAAMAAGVRREAIWLDPGIGFGKTLEHNLALLGGLPALSDLGFRTLLGVSRKSFIRAIDSSATEAVDRLGGSIACALIGAEAGVSAVRVHDVRETAQALKVWTAVRRR
ncbi:MAG TPA: dihydropteroate synthase [Caulobacteraceae bacterium]|nr:dihydropteroate synthase [Caulobacteraceae bacterium]